VSGNSFSYLALGIGLLSGTLFAYGQTPSPMCLSHKRRKPCPAAASPVAVPPSGVLVNQPTIEHRTVATVPVKTAQKGCGLLATAQHFPTPR
jgi:hypothetical protein